MYFHELIWPSNQPPEVDMITLISQMRNRGPERFKTCLKTHSQEVSEQIFLGQSASWAHSLTCYVHREWHLQPGVFPFGKDWLPGLGCPAPSAQVWSPHLAGSPLHLHLRARSWSAWRVGPHSLGVQPPQ